MAIVTDANLAVVLVSRDPRAGAVDRHLRSWRAAGESLHAPTLFPYEVANALVRLTVAGRLASRDLGPAWELVQQLPIQLHPATNGVAVMMIALRLGRQNAYDAAYLALSQELHADLWTLDGP